MTLSLISFTQNGAKLSEQIAECFSRQECLQYTKCKVLSECNSEKNRNLVFEEKKIGEWAKEQMDKKNSLIFIGACGIAVRAVAPHIVDKMHDSPVLVIDELGKYVIPVLSGHIGGANELALLIAKNIGAEAVITTATDINHKFAVDVFAKKNMLSVLNKDGIAKVSSKVLLGKEITFSVEHQYYNKNQILPKQIRVVSYPPNEFVDVVISSENKSFNAALILKPKEFVIGIGCKKGKEVNKITEFIKNSIEKLDISESMIAYISTVDVKKNEEGLLEWSRKNNVPFMTYTAEELQAVEGNFSKSDFVKQTVGVDNVCERAALKACGSSGKLIYEKHIEDGMTIAIAKREWGIHFYE